MTRKTGIIILLLWVCAMGVIAIVTTNARREWKQIEAECVAKGGERIRLTEDRYVCAKVEILK